MKIVFFIQDLYRLGAQYVTALVASGLSEKGHSVTVVVSRIHSFIKENHPEWESFELNNNVNFIELNSKKASLNIIEIREFIFREKPDVVLTMSSNYDIAVAIAVSLISKKKRPLFVPVEHSSGLGLDSKISGIKKGNRLVGEIKRNIVCATAGHVFAVSSGVAKAMCDMGMYKKDYVSVVYNPVISSTFFRKAASPAKHPWLKNKTMPVLVAAGAHVPFKAHDVLINAFNLVLKDCKCRLIVFGEGANTEKLKKMAADLNLSSDISFPGHTNNLPAELKSCDCFVVSSHCESFSVVLVEALACGIPVVSTNCPVGPPEILKNGKYGILVDVNDPSSLAQGVLTVLKGNGISPPTESWEPYVQDIVVSNYEKKLLCLVKRRK